jgi:hypothetical protein
MLFAEAVASFRRPGWNRPAQGCERSDGVPVYGNIGFNTSADSRTNEQLRDADFQGMPGGIEGM